MNETQQARQASACLLNPSRDCYLHMVDGDRILVDREWVMYWDDDRVSRGWTMNQDSISWAELAELTHATQVERFNFCTCEEQEYFPYLDCPRPEIMCGDCIRPVTECGCLS